MNLYTALGAAAQALLGERARVAGLALGTLALGVYYVPSICVTYAATDPRLKSLSLLALLGIPATVAAIAATAAVMENRPEFLLPSAAPSLFVLLIAMAAPVVYRTSEANLLDDPEASAVVSAHHLSSAQIAAVASLNEGFGIAVDWAQGQVFAVFDAAAKIANTVAHGVDGVLSAVARRPDESGTSGLTKRAS